MKKLIQFISNSIHFVENNIQNKVISTLQLVKKLPTSKNYLLQKIAYCKLPTAHCLLPTAHCKKLPTANRLLKKTTYCLLLIAYCQLATAQVYPIQVTPQLIPPYSLKLSDYQTTSSEKLFVNLLLTDTQELGYQVRLKMYIEGQGLNIRTLDFVAGAPPLFLDGGFNLRLSNLDLQAYFNLNNLIGITSRQYSRPLPDGRYDFCFEVYDFFTGQRLSRKSCFPVYLILNDPPILNVPGRGDLVTAQIPQNIIFNWTPRHLNATSVQYEFTLKELWDTGLDPQAAFLSSPPLFQTTTFPTTLLYGPADIQLIEGKTYGWQVRALVSDGISETSVFRNNGYSEIYHFKYEGNCDVPNFIQSEVQNTQTVQIRWSFSDHLRYEIQYRKKGYGDEDWFSVFAYKPQSKIHNLEAGITYEYRVGGECTFQGGFAFSPIYEFTTLTEEEVAYDNCGEPPPKIDLSNKDPLPNIGVNEVFRAADFPVTVLEVQSKGDGVYSGWGFTRIPFLGDTKIRVEFKDIRINTDFQMIRGRVKTTYDPTWKGIEDVEDFTEGLGNLVDVVYTSLEEALEKLGISEGDYEEENIDFEIEDITVNENGETVIIGVNGEEQNLGVGNNTVVTDKNGNIIVVNEDKKTGVISNNNSTTTNTLLAMNIEFKKYLNEKASFDDNNINDYPHYENRFNKPIVWKSLKSGVVDKLIIEVDTIQNDIFLEKDVNISSISPAQITKNTEEISIMSSYNKKEMTVQVRRDSIKGDSIAVFKVISYPKKIINLKLVTLDEENDDVQIHSLNSTVQTDTTTVVRWGKNVFLDTNPQGDDYIITSSSGEKHIVAGVNKICETTANNTNLKTTTPYFNLNELKDYLNKKIYNQANVEWNIIRETDILNFDLNNDGKIDVTNNNLKPNDVNDEYNILINEYSNYNGYVIFLVDNPDDGSLGWFPSTTNVGVVHINTHIKSTKKNQLMNTIGHELGHGAFKLKHPFDEFNNYNQGKDPNNIMDYQDGDKLRKYQWDLIQK